MVARCSPSRPPKKIAAMERWRRVLNVPLGGQTGAGAGTDRRYRVAVSLCLSGDRLAVPSVNAVFFSGDRVESTRDPVIERLSDLETVADLVASKFGGRTNAWVVEASLFNGPFAVYRDFVPSVNPWGEPKGYDPRGFPGSSSTVSLLSACLREVKRTIEQKGSVFNQAPTSSPFIRPKICILGFSKGGTVINQLVTELAFSEVESATRQQPLPAERSEPNEEIHIIPKTRESLLNSIFEIHYVDVGLNAQGAYINDHNVIKRISKRLMQGAEGIRFVLHGTPRQWCDKRRTFIRSEKDQLVSLLESEALSCNGKLQLTEKFYFADRPPDLRMHFEVIQCMDVI